MEKQKQEKHWNILLLWKALGFPAWERVDLPFKKQSTQLFPTNRESMQGEFFSPSRRDLRQYSSAQKPHGASFRQSRRWRDWPRPEDGVFQGSIKKTQPFPTVPCIELIRVLLLPSPPNHNRTYRYKQQSHDNHTVFRDSGCGIPWNGNGHRRITIKIKIK